MINLLKLEIYKLKRNKAFWLISAIDIFVGLIYVMKNGSLVGIKAFQSSMYDIATLMVLGAIFAGLFIGTDFTDRNINQGIVAGYSRIKILFSKVIILFLATEIIMILYPITSVIVNSALNGWGETFNMDTAIYILRTIFLRLIVDSSCISLWVLLAFLFKDILKTVSVSIFIFMMGSGCIITLSKKVDFMKEIYNLTANGQARILVNKTLSLYQITNIMVSNLIIVLVLLSISYLLFRRAELK
jgi:ABC-2 type transport system permease protein